MNMQKNKSKIESRNRSWTLRTRTNLGYDAKRHIARSLTGIASGQGSGNQAVMSLLKQNLAIFHVVHNDRRRDVVCSMLFQTIARALSF